MRRPIVFPQPPAANRKKVSGLNGTAGPDQNRECERVVQGPEGHRLTPEGATSPVFRSPDVSRRAGTKTRRDRGSDHKSAVSYVSAAVVPFVSG